MKLTAGTRLGRYVVVAPLGAGGMGEVWRAHDDRLGRDVAIKVLPAELAADPELLRRFEREAKATAAISHPNILAVHDVGAHEDVPYLVEELLEGEVLRERLKRGPVPVREAVGIALQIARGLAVAHEKRIVHRDLKPENVFITRDGIVKILDFGLAKVVGAVPLGEAETLTRAPTGATEPGRVMGTVAYMAPEQARGLPVDHRADIFAFGVVLHELLSGARPFRGETVNDTIAAILKDEPLPLPSDVPPSLVRLVAQCLEKDPARRTTSARDLVEDLDTVSGAAATAPTASLPPRVRSRSRVMPALAVAASAAALFAGYRLLSGRASRPLQATQFRLISSFPGSHRAPSFSPDGRMLAFLNVEESPPQVWVKPLEGGEPVRITSGDLPAARPRWSPKGDQIIFERRDRGIWSVPTLGGTPRQIADQGVCPAFFPDGERIVFDRGTELWTARVDGSDARKLPGLPENFYSVYVPRCAAVAPDGLSIAFVQPEGPTGDLWITPSSGGTPRRLTTDGDASGPPVWTPDGRHVICSSARRGSRTLWSFPVVGGEPEPLTSGAGEDLDPDISPDGKDLIYVNARRSYALMVLDPASGKQREVIERHSHANGLDLSPDGHRIAFFEATGDLGEQIFTVSTDGRDLRQVTRDEHGRNIMPRWSSDGLQLYFYQELPETSYRRIPADGGASVAILPGWRWDTHTNAVVDPSGRTVAYTFIEGHRLLAARLLDLPTGQERELERPLHDLAWSPDGKRLAGNDEQERIWLCPPDSGACTSIIDGFWPLWSADGARIYFHRRGRPLDDPSLRSLEAWVVAASGGEPRRLGVLEPVHALHTPFDVSPSGEILWSQVRRGRGELWLAVLPTGKG
jgi:eukaryotic-like serine/threonine-protein kinase